MGTGRQCSVWGGQEGRRTVGKEDRRTEGEEDRTTGGQEDSVQFRECNLFPGSTSTQL